MSWTQDNKDQRTLISVAEASIQIATLRLITMEMKETYVKETELRARSLIGTMKIAESTREMFQDERTSPQKRKDDDRRSRDSDIGREPYSPERHYHRADEDRHYESSSSRKNWKRMSSDLVNDISNLFRKERSLISAELGEKASLVKAGSCFFNAGTIISFVGFNALAATIVLALGNVMAWWLAALVTGVGFLLIGLGLMAAARKKLSGDSLTPYRSIESFDHMGSMLKEKRDEFTRH